MLFKSTGSGILTPVAHVPKGWKPSHLIIYEVTNIPAGVSLQTVFTEINRTCIVDCGIPFKRRRFVDYAELGLGRIVYPRIAD